MSLQDLAEEIKRLSGAGGFQRFRVVRASPLTLEEVSGDEVLTAGDEDFTVGAWVAQYKRTYGLTAGQIILVQRDADGWTAAEVEAEDEEEGLHDFSPSEAVPVTGSRGSGAALVSLLSALESLGLIEDQTTA